MKNILRKKSKQSLSFSKILVRYYVIFSLYFFFFHPFLYAKEEIEEDRILGAVLDEVLYADDTIIHFTSPKQIEQLLHKIEQEGAKYGLKLNKGNCEAMAVRGVEDIYFGDGQKVNQMNESK